MLSLILRQYRRITFFSGGMALFFAMCVAQAQVNMGTLSYVAAFLGLLALFTAAALAIYAKKTRHRRLLEISGAGAWVGAFVLLMPGTGTSALILGLVAMIGTAAGLYVFLHSKTSSRIGAETTWRDRYSGHIAYPARLVWRHVVPGAAEPADHCTGMMAHYAPDDDDPDTVHITFKGSAERHSKYTLTFLERDPPNACRFFFQGNEADGTLVDGIFSLRVTVLDRDSCFFSCVEERCGLNLAALVERWFDDALGFQHDRLIDKLDALYGDTYGPDKSAMLVAE